MVIRGLWDRIKGGVERLFGREGIAPTPPVLEEYLDPPPPVLEDIESTPPQLEDQPIDWGSMDEPVPGDPPTMEDMPTGQPTLEDLPTQEPTQDEIDHATDGLTAEDMEVPEPRDDLFASQPQTQSIRAGGGLSSRAVGNSVALSGPVEEEAAQGGLVGEEGFWAKITDSAEADDPAKNRWLYGWEEVEKTVVGYPATPGTVDNWTTLSGGRSGTTGTDPAYNTIENMNNATNAHVEGNGVDPENVADVGTFAMMPCTTDNIVWMRPLTFTVDEETYTEYWFSYENGVDGTC